MDQELDLLVIGAGPGGYAAAIRASQLGLRTALVERSELGGVCLNLGCIPSKAMLRSAEVVTLIRHASEHGISTGEVTWDYRVAAARRDQAVAKLLQGLVNLLRGNNVTVLRGDAQLQGPNTCRIEGTDGSYDVGFRHLIVATGSAPAPIPVEGASLDGVVDSDGALALQDAPRRAVIIGGGAVGVEWADIWRAFGSDVAILEMLPRLVPTEEPEIARELARAFTRKAIVCQTSAQVQAIRQDGEALEVRAIIEGEERGFAADTVLVAVGRRPNVSGLGLEAAGVETGPRGIPVDDRMRTNAPHIFAIGDVTGRSLLAHAATHQGIIAAETIAGRKTQGFDPSAVPAAVFTDPEIASIGIREADAREQKIPITIARFPFAAIGRAEASGETTGFVKIVAREDDHKVLGVHIIGGPAGDLIGEAALGIRLGATLDDFAATIHVHPTFSEVLHEAALVGLGTPLHVPPRRRTREQESSEQKVSP